MEILYSCDIETACQDGYPLYRIPGIVCTNKGTLIVYYECRCAPYIYGSHLNSDLSVIDVGMKVSHDKGKTWSERKIIASSRGRNASNNPVMFVDGDRIHFIYMENYKRAFYKYSDDEGETWSDAVEITDSFDEIREQFPWTTIAVGPGHGTVLKNGRIIVPVWMASDVTCIYAHTPSVTATLYSDDHGNTWHMGDVIPTLGIVNPNESCMAELSDGTVYISIRHQSPDNDRYRCISKSKTGIDKWQRVYLDKGLQDPICEGGLCRFDKGILFTNCDSPQGRFNLTLKKSTDDGQTWEGIVYEKNGGYSDVAYDYETGNAFVFYEKDVVNELVVTAISI